MSAPRPPSLEPGAAALAAAASALTAALALAGLGACTEPAAREEAQPRAPETPPRAVLERSEWSSARGADPAREVLWRPVDTSAVPRNRDFDLEVLVLRDGAPAPVDSLKLDGWMPAHNHGFVQLPLVQRLGTGHFRVEGVLLHMRGKWELRFGLSEHGAYETVVAEVVL